MNHATIRMMIPVTAFALCAGAYTAEARTQSSDRQSHSDRYSSSSDRDSSRGSSMEGSSHREKDRSSSRFQSRWPQVSGEIERAKKVTVRGTRQEHLAALLMTEQGRRVVVDLGPAKALRDLELQSGDWISARGPVIRINDRRVLFAKQIRTDGQTVRIKRHSPPRQQDQSQQASSPVNGQVETIKELKVKGTGKTHQVVRLKTQGGQQILADLGAKKDLRDVNIKTGQQLTLEGPMIRLGGKPFVLAKQISTDNRTVQIDRTFMSAIPASRSGQSEGRGTQSIRGEVIVRGEVLKVDRDGFYVVKEPSGRQVHLLVAEDMNKGFKVGDQIQAQVKEDGSVTSISKSSGQPSGQPSGQSSGQSKQSDSSMQSSQR